MVKDGRKGALTVWLLDSWGCSVLGNSLGLSMLVLSLG